MSDLKSMQRSPLQMLPEELLEMIRLQRAQRRYKPETAARAKAVKAEAKAKVKTQEGLSKLSLEQIQELIALAQA